MALTYQSNGSSTIGGSTATQGLPAGWQPKDLAVLVIASVQEEHAMPTLVPVGGPWTYMGTATDSDATAITTTNVGARRLTFYVRELATGDGSVTINLPQTLYAALDSRIILLRKAATESWRVSTPVFGEDASSGTAFSATMSGVPSRTETGAFLVAARAGKVSTAQTMSAQTITATGATVGAVTERSDITNDVYGGRVHLGIWSGSVTAGTATAAPVIGATLAVADTGIGGVLPVLAVTGSLTAAQATRGDVVRINGITNPGAEQGSTSGWVALQSVGVSTIDVVDVIEEGLGPPPSDPDSRRAFRVTGAATNTSLLGLNQTLPMQYPAGTTVTVSADFYIPPGSPADQIRFGMATPAGATVSTGSVNVTGSGWGRYSYTWTVTGAAGLGRVYPYTADSQNLRGADTIYIDNVMLDVHPTVRPYMDGDSNLDGYVHQWLGTPGFSESAQYLPADPPRVGVTLFNWANDDTVQIYRVHADGTRHEVRSGLVTPSGGAAFVWDYEFPTNEEFYYTAMDSGTERATSLLDEVTLRRNSALNPAMTVDATGWTAYAGDRGTVTGTRVDGATDGPMVGGVRRDYFRMQWSTITTGTVDGTGIYYGQTAVSDLAVTPGPVAMSIYWRSNVLDRTMALVVDFYNASNAIISGASITGPTSGPSSGRWIRATMTGTVPAGAVRARAHLFGVGGAVWAVGNTLDATALLNEDNVAAVGPYFDGDTPGTGYRWNGAVGASFSEEVATDVLTPLAVNDSRSFLRSPGLPGLDTTVRFGRVPEQARPRPINYLAPIGRRTLVPQASSRQASAQALDIVTLTDAEAEALLALLDETPIALMLFPGTRLHGKYVALGDLAEKPNPRVGPQEAQWTVASTVVERPAGGVAYDPLASWAGILATSGTWQSVLNTYPSWLDVLRGPPEVD